jgi:hypothetical protein
MVDGKTIDRLRQDMTAVTKELTKLSHLVFELEERIKIMEGIDSKKNQSSGTSLPQNDRKD